MLIHYIVPVLCVPLITYPLDYDTFLFAHKANSKWLYETSTRQNEAH